MKRVSESIPIFNPKIDKEVRFGEKQEVYFRPDSWVLESPQESFMAKITETRIRRLSDESTADSYNTRAHRQEPVEQPKSILKKPTSKKKHKACCVIA